LVKAEYRYFRSAWSAAFCFSVRAADMPEPIPKLDHSADMLDMTLRTLVTERIEPTSELWLLDRWDWPRNET
jgi:hypothetical protein